MKFYKCLKCGNVLFSLNEKDLTCCKEKMILLESLENEGAKEKHIPVYKVRENELEVMVGDVLHPMEDKHYIEFIAYLHDNNITITYLKPNDIPKATFKYLGKGIIYSYCNIHGLWKKEIK